MAKDTKVKKPILRWKGILAGRNKYVRLMTFIIIAVATAALSFTQLGFAGIGFSGHYTAYIVVLLQPVAVGALLLGTLSGVIMGLWAGVLLLVHSIVMPLDYYELVFVTPVSSVVMLTLSGFLLGVLFAFAFRNNPSFLKRVIYGTIICFFVSSLYSTGFVINAIASLFTDMVSRLADSYSESELISDLSREATRTALRLGDVGTQIFMDALLMIALCIVAEFLARQAMRLEGAVSVRTLFAAWLFAVVFLVFMITAAISFAAITVGTRNTALEDFRSETMYLCKQLNLGDKNSGVIVDYLNEAGIDFSSLSEDELTTILESAMPTTLLDGYEQDADGSVIITIGDYVYMSNIPAISPGSALQDYFPDDVIKAIKTSAQTQTMQRIIYDDPSKMSKIQLDDTDTSAYDAINTELAYVYAENTPDADFLSQKTAIIIRPFEMIFASRGEVMQWTTLSSLALLLTVFLLTSRLLGIVVVRRIDETNQVLSRVTAGDLKARVDAHDTLEFNSLSEGINNTVSALKGWIAEAETRMDAELATAKEIQEAALPRIFPPYPDILRFDIYATMHAAKEVGGDFYDFFLIGDDANQTSGKLGFVIADVSGKGVPAALFMMKAKTQLRDYMASGMDIGQAVENANRQLCDGNDKGMFVTAWVGILDYGTGRVDFVNAGHNPPLFWQKGAWHWVKEKSGMPLGLFDGLPYEAFSLECEIGDQLLLYTDGVTESMSVDNELYGEEKLFALASKNYTLHPRELTDVVRRDISIHARGAEQSDDITILALEVGVPPELTATLTVAAKIDELPRVNNFIHTELDRRLCPVKVQNQLDIAVEELFVNVARYAYPEATPEKPGLVRISYTYSADPPSITVDIADQGVPYNPLEKPDAVTPNNIVDVPIGGLGILMAKRSVDDMRYEYVDGSNVVTIVKKW